MKRKIIIITIVVVSIFSVVLYYCNFCSHNEISIEKELSNGISNNVFSFRNIYKEKEWDSIYIIKPYDNVRRYNIIINEADKDEIDSYSNYDNVCTILFVNKGSLVAYSSVSRGFIDFCDVKKIKFSKIDNFTIEGKKVRDLN